MTTTCSALNSLVSPLQVTVEGNVMNRAMSRVSMSRAELTFSVVLQSAVTETMARMLLTQKKNVSTQMTSAWLPVTSSTAPVRLENAPV